MDTRSPRGNTEGIEDTIQGGEGRLDSESVDAGQPDRTGRPPPSYGDLTSFNDSGLIRTSVGVPLLSGIADDLMDLLNSSCAIYEKTGDYAIGPVSCDWCRFMDHTSRQLCGTDDNREALRSGKWHCRESCGNEAALQSMKAGKRVDMACRGGIRTFAVPIWAGRTIVGSLGIGYGNPPRNPAKLEKLAILYGVTAEDLSGQAKGHETRPPFLLELTRKKALSSARLIGEIVTRKLNEQEPHSSEEKFKTLLDFAKDAIFIHDQEGHIFEANQEASERLGYSHDEFLRMNLRDFIVPEQAALFTERLETLQKKGHYLFESVHRRRDGSPIPVETSVRLFKLAGRQMCLAVCRDITERKQAEMALTDSEKRFSVFMEQLPAAVFIKDQAGRFLFANRHLKEMFGWRECVGKTVEDLVSQETAGQMTADDRRALTEGPTVFQERITDVHGTERFFDTYKFPIKVAGSPTLLGGVAVETTERVRTERELARTRILLQSAFSQTPVPTTLASAPEGIIIHSNRAMADMLGIEDPDDPSGRRLSEMDPTWRAFDGEGSRVPYNKLPLAMALEGITTRDRELVIQRKDGTRRSAIVSAAPILNEAGEMIAAIAAYPDITELKRAKEALEKRIVALTQPLGDLENVAFEDLFNLPDLQRLQDLFADTWGVAALITRPDGTAITTPSNFTYFCDRFVRRSEKGSRRCQVSDAALGRHSPSGPIIRTCLSAGLWGAGVSITVAGRHLASWLIGQVRNETQSEERIMAYAREIGADETEFREAFLKVPVMPQEKFERIAHALFAMANQLSNIAYQNIQQARFITERKQAEEALRESEGRFRRMVESSPLAIGLANQDSTIEYVNPKFVEMFGYGIDDIPRLQDWFRLAFPDPLYRQSVLERWQEMWDVPADETASARRIEVEFTCKDGSVKTVEIFRSRMGSRTFEVFNDLTERKRMDRERRRLDAHVREIQKLESLGVLAGGIAHDFNNLLMAILGNADLALLRLPQASPARRHIEEITSGAQRAADLCRQMLAYSGRGHFVVGYHDISKIVQDMGQILDVSVTKKATMRYSLADGVPLVKSDAAQIRQVVMNLVTNASDALGDASGIITVTTGVMDCSATYLSESFLHDDLPAGHYVFLDVSDTGCGMDADTQSKIFDPFFTTKFIGRGLGLAAVLGIVRGHMGAIKVQSEVGKGTTFRVLLPALEPTEAQLKDPQSETFGLKQGGVILLVDDNPSIRDVVSQMLEELGYKVLTAADGQKAVRIFKDHAAEVACVILDLVMPEMDGEEAFGKLRSLRGDVKVILSSGYNEPDATRRFGGKGLAGFVQKPYTLEKLQTALDRVLK